MANVYADTVLLDARAFIAANLNKKFELRRNLSKVTDAFLMDREFTVPNLSAIKKANTQATKAMYYKALDFTIISAKSNTPTGEMSGTGIVTLSWSQSGFEVKVNSKQLAGNEVDPVQSFAYSLYNGERTFWDDFDSSILLAWLDTNKSTVNSGESGTFATGLMTVAVAAEDQFYNLLDGDMALNNMTGEFIDIHSTYWLTKARHYAHQGSMNDETLDYQFAGFHLKPSNNLAKGTGNVAMHYIIPRGGVSLLDWNHPDNRGGKTGANGQLTTMQSMFYPQLSFDVFIKESWADSTADGGDVQDLTYVYEFILNYSVAKQPFTTAGLTPIFKYANSAT